MDKVEILDARIASTISKISEAGLKYELNLLFGEYKKQVDHKIKEVKRSCQKKRK